MAVEGSNPIVNISSTKLFETFDTSNYFSNELPAINKQDSRIPGPRRRYKIAYLILVQELDGFQQLKMLLETIDDGESVILIHVEVGQDRLYNSIDEYLKENEIRIKAVGNVFMAKYRFKNIFKHISLVYTYLSGFFELQDLADWDYVINLSNYDWPLRRNAELHRILDMNPGCSYIDFWSSTGTSV